MLEKLFAYSISLEITQHLLPSFIFPRVRLDQKCCSAAISLLKMIDCQYPVWIEFNIVYAVL